MVSRSDDSASYTEPNDLIAKFFKGEGSSSKFWPEVQKYTEAAALNLNAIQFRWPWSKTPDTLPSDFWEQAKQLGDKVYTYANQRINEIKTDRAVATRIDDIQKTYASLLEAGVALSAEVTALEHVQGSDVNANGLIEDMEKVLGELFEKLKSEFPPPDQAPSHQQRKESIHKALGYVEETLVTFLEQRGMSEEAIRAQLDKLLPLLEGVMIMIGNLFEQRN